MPQSGPLGCQIDKIFLSTAGRGVRLCSGAMFDQRSRELERRNGNEDRDDDNQHVRNMYSRDPLSAGSLSVPNPYVVTYLPSFAVVFTHENVALWMSSRFR